jgi:PAS domain S-box-containing protein
VSIVRKAVTGVERFFDKSDIIVSKTDLTGKITYCNRIFMRISGYSEKELLGHPHSILRHPDMPRCVFKLLWGRLAEGQEIFAYVVNRTKNGDHYWVLAHVTPTRDGSGAITGYHSSRRLPDSGKLEKIKPLYHALLAEEGRHADRKAGLDASLALLNSTLEGRKITYDQFLFSL